MNRQRVAITSATILVAAGIAAGGTMAASAGSTPTPTPTPTVSVPPTVNPFAACSFSTTESFTFDPIRHRFVADRDPAIVCDTPRGARVYDLLPGPVRR